MLYPGLIIWSSSWSSLLSILFPSLNWPSIPHHKTSKYQQSPPNSFKPQNLQRSQLIRESGKAPWRGALTSITYLHSILGQFMWVCSTHDLVPFDARVGDLAGDILVAQTHNQAILWGIVSIFSLERQAFPGIVIGASLATPLEFNLVPLEVLLILHHFHETLQWKIDEKCMKSRWKNSQKTGTKWRKIHVHCWQKLFLQFPL